MIIQKIKEKYEIKLSIIIPLYNSKKTIIKCLNSIFLQEQNWIEVIIINDCSKDSSLKLVKNFINTKHINNLKIINCKKNIGPGECRNLGLKISEGHFVNFLDSDDFLVKNSLKNIKNYLENDWDLIINNTERKKNPKNNSFFFKQFKSKKFVNNNYIQKSIAGELHFNECWKIIAKRANIVKKKIYFPNLYIGEDQCFINKLILNSQKIFLNRNVFLHHTDNSKGLSSMNEQQEMLSNLNIINFLKKLKFKNNLQKEFINQKIQILKNTIAILALSYSLIKITKITKNYKAFFKNYLIKIYKENDKFIKKIVKYLKLHKPDIFIYGKNNLAKSLSAKLKKIKIKVQYIFDDNSKFKLKTILNYKFINLNKKIFIITINDKYKSQIVANKIKKLKIKNYEIFDLHKLLKW